MEAVNLAAGQGLVVMMTLLHKKKTTLNRILNNVVLLKLKTPRELREEQLKDKDIELRLELETLIAIDVVGRSV